MDLIYLPSGNALAFGLDWKPLDMVMSRHKNIVYLQQVGYRLSASYRSEGITMLGLTQVEQFQPSPDGRKPAAVICGAACVALHPKLRGRTAFVVIEAADALAVVALDRGLVRGDALVSPEAVPGLQQDFQTMLAERPFEVIHIGGPQDPIQLSDLERMGRRRGATQLRALRSYRAVWIAGGLGVLALTSALAWWAVDHFYAQEAQAAKRRMELANAPETKYRESISALLGKPVVRVTDGLNAIRSALWDFPVAHAGFELQKVVCSHKGACTATFSRMTATGVTWRDFAQTPSAHWSAETVVPLDIDLVRTSFSVEMPQSTLQRQRWDKEHEVRFRLVEQWQFLAPGGWKAWVSQTAAPQGMPVSFNATDASRAAAMPDAVHALTFSIDKQPWWYAEPDPDSPLSEAALGNDAVLTGDVEIDVSAKDVMFSTKGLIYVKR